MLRPRPIKQQQDYITENNSSVATRIYLLSKDNFVQKTSKSDMMTSYVWHCFCTYCTKKIQVLITFQHYHVTQRLVGHNSVGSKTKSIRPRLRPRTKLQDQDQDRGQSETGPVIRPRSQIPILLDILEGVLLSPIADSL